MVQRHANADEPEYVQTSAITGGAATIPLQRALDAGQTKLLDAAVKSNQGLTKTIDTAFNGMFSSRAMSAAVVLADAGEMDTALTSNGLPRFADLPRSPGGYSQYVATVKLRSDFGATRPAAGTLNWITTGTMGGYWARNALFVTNDKPLLKYWLENLADARQLDNWLAVLPDGELLDRLMEAKALLSGARITELNRSAMSETSRGNISAERKEVLQSFGQHGVYIDPEMDALLRQALLEIIGNLPAAHVAGNPMLSLIQQGKGLASFYSEDARGMQINVPPIMTVKQYSKQGKTKLVEFLYHWIDPNVRGKGKRGKRSTFGIWDWRKSKQTADPLGKSDSLMRWSMRHEFGHSVDAMLHFDKSPKIQERAFGKWVGYQDGAAAAAALLQDAGVSPRSDILKAFVEVMSGNRSRKALMKDLKRLPKPADWFKVQEAAKAAEVGLTLPYQFRDGGGQILNGDRIYHQDYHGDWYSYSSDVRDNTKLSNYQWANPAEWFAECYAAYYDPKPAVKNALNNSVAAWFKNSIDTESPSL